MGMMPNPRPRKTSRRVGQRRKFQPGFYLTKEAEEVISNVKGNKSAFINQAIVQYAQTKRKEEK